MTTMTETTMRHTLTTPTDRTIRVERIFDATRDRVWRAYTEPALVAQWWGRGNKLVIEKLEVERGGHWRFVEHADGAFRILDFDDPEDPDTRRRSQDRRSRSR